MKTYFSNSILFALLFLFIACSNDDSEPTETETETDKVVPIIAAPTFNDFYASIVDQVSQADLTNTLQTYEDFGDKVTGNTELDQVQTWIEDTYVASGYDRDTAIENQSFSVDATTGTNIIVTKKGTKFPDTYIILCAHYDATAARTNGIARGTNDNGSGTAILLEIAKLLKDIDTDYSIRFIHFSGEEQGLVGSNAYVNSIVRPANFDIRLVFNIDMVGGEKGAANVLVCERGVNNPGKINDTSEEFTLAIQEAAKLYSSVNTTIGTAFASDYVAFEANAEVITGLYNQGGQNSLYYHSQNDLLENMDLPFFTEVTKTAVGAVLHIAVAEEVAM